MVNIVNVTSREQMVFNSALRKKETSSNNCVTACGAEKKNKC